MMFVFGKEEVILRRLCPPIGDTVLTGLHAEVHICSARFFAGLRRSAAFFIATNEQKVYSRSRCSFPAQCASSISNGANILDTICCRLCAGN